MPRQAEKNNTKIIAAFAALSVILFFTAVMRAFDYQLVNGEQYLSMAHRNSYTTVKIPAARGEIVDRNGVPFTKNIARFSVQLDYSFLKRGEENKTIYNLIKTFEARGETWIDELPITLEQPYTFIEGRENDVAKLKTRIGVADYATAQDCMDGLYEYNDSRYATDKELHDIDGVEYREYSEEYKRKIAGVRYSMLASDFSAYNPRYTFSESIDSATVVLLNELSDDFAGVEILQTAERSYIGGEVASHVLGRLGKMNENQLAYYTSLEGEDYAMDDLVGQGGVEEAFESLLKGKKGELRIVKDSKGNVVDVIESITPEAGKTIALTIDYEFNKQVNQILSDFIDEFNETNDDDKHIDAASVVVLDKQGGLLAVASYPYYDQAEYYTSYSTVAQAEGNPLFNRALQGLYRPGSTFKPVVAAAGLDAEVIDVDTKIFCDGYYHYWSDWKPLPSCLGDSHLNTNVGLVSALRYSCNVFFYETGRLLGDLRLKDYANMFGLGTETGLEISNRVGVISNREYSESMGTRWEAGNIAQAAIGQLDTQVTPLQMALEAMTIGNKGDRYNAHLLKGVYSYDQSELLQDEKISLASSLDMTENAFEEIKEGMVEAGLRISGNANLADLGYSVAVKTGTPQVTVEKTNNAFVAFAPADDAEISISCMLEDGLRATQILKPILQAYEECKKTTATVE